MINIIIVGAGELGKYIASILSKEKHSIIIIDKDPKVLEEVSSTLDVATRQGSGTDLHLLDDLLEFSPDLFIALTGNDEENLVACSIAKLLNYPRTIARIKDSRYASTTRLDFGHIFNVDKFIAPELLAANEIIKCIKSPQSIFIENFAQGALQLRTILIPETWQGHSEPLKNFNLPPNIIVSLIRGEEAEEGTGALGKRKVIFPHGNDAIFPGDEVTFIGEAEAINNIDEFFGVPQKNVKSLVIAGGTLTGLHLAQHMPKDIDIKVIEKDYDTCAFLAEKLPHCTIIQQDATNVDFLHSEKIGTADIFIACTNNDEYNLLAALLSKEIGCEEAIIVLKEAHFVPLVKKLGLKHTVSPRTSAASQILSQLYSGKITSLTSLYENQAVVLEIKVSMESKIVGIPLSELGPFLPKDFLIVMIQNRGRIMIAKGDRVISPGDNVIVVTSPKYVEELNRIF